MKASKNCYTCRERKIGCDRSLPRCRNCQRSSRTCQGYGLKLSWPDDSKDGRRKSLIFESAPLQQTSSDYVYLRNGLPFLNTTVQDLVLQRVPVRQLLGNSSSEIPPVVSLGVLGKEDHGSLLSYYESILSRMITTVDDAGNGFRNHLLPLALSSKDLSSQSLLKATLALSAFHLGRPSEALRYKVAAIKALSASIDSGIGSQAAQLATCMMLCVNSVFDASDNSWTIHLQGARTLVHGACVTGATGSQAFLLDWFAYHDVLQNYTQCHGLGTQQTSRNMIIQPHDAENLRVIGLLGCSREVLYLISCINQLRCLPPDERLQQREIADNIRNRLQCLQQEVHVTTGAKAGILNVERISLTADFYRKAAQLYLEQVLPAQHSHDHFIENLIDDCFTILDQLGLCTSPWPLFILANWCSEDEHRIKILAILEGMNYKRRIGNVEVMEKIIRALWRRVDLHTREKKYHNIDWRDLIDTNDFMPSFI